MFTDGFIYLYYTSPIKYPMRIDILSILFCACKLFYYYFNKCASEI